MIGAFYPGQAYLGDAPLDDDSSATYGTTQAAWLAGNQHSRDFLVVVKDLANLGTEEGVEQ